jgi:hypothetical protein
MSLLGGEEEEEADEEEWERAWEEVMGLEEKWGVKEEKEG